MKTNSPPGSRTWIRSSRSALAGGLVLLVAAAAAVWAAFGGPNGPDGSPGTAPSVAGGIQSSGSSAPTGAGGSVVAPDAEEIVRQFFRVPVERAMEDSSSTVYELAPYMVNFFRLATAPEGGEIRSVLSRVALSAEEPGVVRGLAALVLAQSDLEIAPAGLIQGAPVVGMMAALGSCILPDLVGTPGDPRLDEEFWQSFLLYLTDEGLIRAGPTDRWSDEEERIGTLALDRFRAEGDIREVLRSFAGRAQPYALRHLALALLHSDRSLVGVADYDLVRSIAGNEADDTSIRLKAVYATLTYEGSFASAAELDQFLAAIFENTEDPELRRALPLAWESVASLAAFRSPRFWQVATEQCRLIRTEPDVNCDPTEDLIVFASSLQPLTPPDEFLEWYRSNVIAGADADTVQRAIGSLCPERCTTEAWMAALLNLSRDQPFVVREAAIEKAILAVRSGQGRSLSQHHEQIQAALESLVRDCEAIPSEAEAELGPDYRRLLREVQRLMPRTDR